MKENEKLYETIEIGKKGLIFKRRKCKNLAELENYNAWLYRRIEE